MFHHEVSDMFERVDSLRHDQQWQVRVVAARSLPVVPEGVPLEWIRELLLDKHKRVRIATLESCSSKELRECVPAQWIIICMSDAEWSVRAAAVWCIGFYGKQAPAKRLIEIAQDDDEHGEVRASAIFSLSKLAAPTHRELFLKYLDSASWQMREASLLALEDWAEQYTILFLRALHDESVFVRAAAVQVVGSLSSRIALPALLPMLNDDELVSSAAIEAVNRLGQRAIAEVVGLAAFMPTDAPLHAIIREEVAIVYKGDGILQRLLAFIPACKRLSISLNLSSPSQSAYTIEELLTQRETRLWNNYVDALADLLFTPGETTQQLTTVHHLYVLLLKHIDEQQRRTHRFFQSVKFWLLPELVFGIGEAALHLSWQLPRAGFIGTWMNATIYVHNEQTLEQVQNERTPVYVSLHLRLTHNENESQTQHVAIINLLRSYTTTPQKLWHGLLSAIQLDVC